MADKEDLSLNGEQICVDFFGPGVSVLWIIHLFGEMENYVILIFAEKLPSFLN